MNVDKGWHLYANPPGQDDFVSSQTELKVEGKMPVSDLKITYPDGKLIIDPILGRYMVYEDKIVIKASFKGRQGTPAHWNSSSSSNHAAIRPVCYRAPRR